jgi:hypothetical protein
MEEQNEVITTAEEQVRVPLATHSFLQRYLYAFASHAEVRHHVRTQCVEEEVRKLPQILDAWMAQQPKVAALVANEAGVAEQVDVQPLPASCDARLNAIRGDALFSRTFSNHQTSFALVDADKLVAAQRTVNFEYVDRLRANYPKTPTLEDLIEICLAPARPMEPIQHLEIQPNTHVFSSPNSDVRFLGAFVKELTATDLESAVMGGRPAAAVIAFVGYGSASVNVFQAGQRMVLNNGFHRIYALRLLGVQMIPVVVRHVVNAALEFPPQVCGLPSEYLLGVQRPVLIKDFFEPDFTITLKVRERIKSVMVSVAVNQHDVPA